MYLRGCGRWVCVQGYLDGDEAFQRGLLLRSGGSIICGGNSEGDEAAWGNQGRGVERMRYHID